MSEIMHKKIGPLCTVPAQQEWFTLSDCCYRYSLVLLGFGWAITTTPLSFGYYTFKHNMLWYGPVKGFLMSLGYPVMPLVLAGAQVVKSIKKIFDPADWQMDGPGRVFFLKPKNPIAAFIWDCYLTQSMYVGQFWLVGTNADAISHTWVDTLLTKDMWREALTKVDARLPRQLAVWEDNKLKIECADLVGHDLVVKLDDSYLGIGDNFWHFDVDYKTEAELRAKMDEAYTNGGFEGRRALVLEMVKPKKDLGVHSLDIITMRTPDDDVKVISVLLWADCTTSSSHSTQAGYTIDIETETVVAPAGWYSPFFATMETPLIGDKYIGIRKAAHDAVEAHKQIKYKWLTAVGWDCMILKNNEVVFFEGNFAGARTPRRMFMSFEHFWAFTTNLFWPFGHGNSARPGAQAFA
eukprot:m.113536 g.113536  ORF g.113536 m.113536 type:complete len:408 (+) comp21466_c0_seq1:128-1351(+)